MRVLIDTSAYISYLLNPSEKSTIHFILEKVSEGEITILISRKLIDEIEVTVRRKPHLIKKITEARLTEFIEMLKIIAETISPIESPIPRMVRDKTDDFLIAYAVIGEAKCIVTTDKDLIVLGELDGIKMLHTRDFREKYKGF